MARRATTGRQRVEIKKIENPDALQVTFSKRRSGLFKKACELAILCGAEVLILVFSPAGRPYSFGSPDVQSLIDRYLNGSPTHIVDPYMGKGILVQSLANEFTDLTNIRDRERTRISNLRQFVKDLGAPYNEEDLSVNELEQYVASLDALKARLAHHIEQLKSMEDINANLINTQVYTGPQDGANMFVPMDAFHINHMLPTHINVPHPHNSAMGIMNFPYHINMVEPTNYYYAGNFEFDYAGNIVQAPVAQNNLVIPGNPNDIGASGVNDYHGVPPFGAHQNNGANYHGGI